MSAHPLLVIIGATASGKTKLAVSVAKEINAEIISADSRQVFRNMSIGTGKDLNEYTLGSIQIPYHLIDIKNAGEKYNVHEFKDDFYQAFGQITERKKIPILCGGTGMYVHSILQEHELTAVPIDLNLRNKLQPLSKTVLLDQLDSYPKHLTKQADRSSSKRIIRAIEIAEFLSHHQLEVKTKAEISPLIIGLQTDVDKRRIRIIKRLNDRLNNGLIEEVAALLKNGISKEDLIFYGLEYKFVTAYLSGEINFDTLRERLGIAICQFAKRQMTFFRKMEKDGARIHWLNAEDNPSQLLNQTLDLFTSNLNPYR